VNLLGCLFSGPCIFPTFAYFTLYCCCTNAAHFEAPKMQLDEILPQFYTRIYIHNREIKTSHAPFCDTANVPCPDLLCKASRLQKHRFMQPVRFRCVAGLHMQLTAASLHEKQQNTGLVCFALCSPRFVGKMFKGAFCRAINVSHGADLNLTTRYGERKMMQKEKGSFFLSLRRRKTCLELIFLFSPDYIA
jgi:hypothetical protein